jgi:hypothetical protein
MFMVSMNNFPSLVYLECGMEARSVSRKGIPDVSRSRMITKKFPDVFRTVFPFNTDGIPCRTLVLSNTKLYPKRMYSRRSCPHSVT